MAIRETKPMADQTRLRAHFERRGALLTKYLISPVRVLRATISQYNRSVGIDCLPGPEVSTK
mgnify:CR=1 FL=1